MTLSRTDTVDAIGLRTGWVVISIHHFGEWDDDTTELLRAKIATALAALETHAFQSKYWWAPVRIELESVEPLPYEAAELCEQLGVVVRAD